LGSKREGPVYARRKDQGAAPPEKKSWQENQKFKRDGKGGGLLPKERYQVKNIEKLSRGASFGPQHLS